MSDDKVRTVTEVAGVHEPLGRYAHASVWNGLAFISGCGPFDESATLVGEGDAAAQTRQVLANARLILERLGVSASHVLKETVYLTDIQDRFATRVERESFYRSHLPASTLIGVSELTHPKMLVEMDFVVALPSPARD
jgi:2-iminobutanoate/2-iminopropanoate deaminase